MHVQLVVVDELKQLRPGDIADSVMPERVSSIQVACQDDWVVLECDQNVLKKLEVVASVRKWLKVNIYDYDKNMLKVKFDSSYI